MRFRREKRDNGAPAEADKALAANVRAFHDAWESLTYEQKSRLWRADPKAYWAAIKLTSYWAVTREYKPRPDLNRRV